MKKTFSKFFTLILLSLFAWPSLSSAGYGLETTQQAAELPTGNVPAFLGQVAGAALALAGSIFLFLIIYGGIMIMTSAGTDRVAKGQKIITYAIIGAVLLGAAYAITALVFSAVTGSAT